MAASIPKSIKDLGKATLTKVANKFVDFIITKYTGKSIKVFEAEGDIEADKVKTKWEILEKPFWLQAEAVKMNREYSNLGNTLLKASPLITALKNTISNENDVFWGFIEHSKSISNKEMQDLIAKIIAGEYNSPGFYTMSALHTVKMLGKSELKLLEKISSLLISDGQLPYELFAGRSNTADLMKKVKIDFGHLQILQCLGLFMPNEMRRTLDNEKGKNLSIDYFEKKLAYSPENENFKKINLPGFYQISPVGKQILKHLNPKFSKDYFEWLKKHYIVPNYKLVVEGPTIKKKTKLSLKKDN